MTAKKVLLVEPLRLHLLDTVTARVVAAMDPCTVFVIDEDSSAVGYSEPDAEDIRCKGRWRIGCLCR
jgi:hypothetical protein